MRIHRITTSFKLQSLNLATAVDPFAEGAQLHLVAGDDSDHPHAGCSLWIHGAPSLERERLGCIGHFHADSAEAAAAVLDAACEELAQRGLTLAVGPMNGNTWRKYRFVTESNGEPPFALEPANSAAWPDYWRAAGFAPLAGYHSSAFPTDGPEDPRLPRVEERFVRAGIAIRPLDRSRFLDDLRKIYEVSVQSFAGNYLYTPIGFDDFANMYLPFQDKLDPRFALIAERGERPLGFVFCLPDFAQAARGAPIVTLIVKTLAVRPERACAGLGVVLVERMRRAAREAGFRRLIHALMHDRNDSANIGQGEPAIVRRYTLFAKRLANA